MVARATCYLYDFIGRGSKENRVTHRAIQYADDLEWSRRFLIGI